MLFSVLLLKKSAHMKSMFLRCAFVVLSISMLGSYLHAGIVTFGSDGNQFNMEFVTIGNPGNAPDTDPNARPISATLGAVGYTYGIGKFEVSEGMITKFNASQSLQIAVSGRGVNKPATYVSWNEAARFVNWLNTSTGGFAAYKFTTGGVNDNIAVWTASDTLDYDASNPYRSKRATYVLPSYNEWYKAAYYNPSNSTYYDFPNGSDIRPTAVTGGLSGAVYTQAGEASPTGPTDVTNAGGLSPYGVMGLGGNVFEWDENSFDLTNSSGSSLRGFRGGGWFFNSSYLPSSARINGGTGDKIVDVGFRVASLSSSAPPAVPEPSMLVIGTLFGLGGLVAKRRRKK
ncbi:MAG: SUMF1/EgtB/PvdO family nonheme iron enzyme [Burkholderiaceae bacterium]